MHAWRKWTESRWQLQQTIRVTGWMTAAENHSGCSVRSAGFLLRCHHFHLINLLSKYEWGMQNNMRKQHEVWNTHTYIVRALYVFHLMLQWALSFEQALLSCQCLVTVNVCDNFFFAKYFLNKLAVTEHLEQILFFLNHQQICLFPISSNPPYTLLSLTIHIVQK